MSSPACLTKAFPKAFEEAFPKGLQKPFPKGIETLSLEVAESATPSKPLRGPFEAVTHRNVTRNVTRNGRVTLTALHHFGNGGDAIRSHGAPALTGCAPISASASYPRANPHVTLAARTV